MGMAAGHHLPLRKLPERSWGAISYLLAASLAGRAALDTLDVTESDRASESVCGWAAGSGPYSGGVLRGQVCGQSCGSGQARGGWRQSTTGCCCQAPRGTAGWPGAGASLGPCPREADPLELRLWEVQPCAGTWGSPGVPGARGSGSLPTRWEPSGMSRPAGVILAQQPHAGPGEAPGAESGWLPSGCRKASGRPAGLLGGSGPQVRGTRAPAAPSPPVLSTCHHPRPHGAHTHVLTHTRAQTLPPPHVCAPTQLPPEVLPQKMPPRPVSTEGPSRGGCSHLRPNPAFLPPSPRRCWSSRRSWTRS